MKMYLWRGKLSEDLLQDLGKALDVCRWENSIVTARRNLHRQVRYPVLPTVEVVSPGVEVAGMTASVPRPILGDNKGSRSIVARWVQFPHGIQVLSDIHRQLGFPLLADLREVL